MLQLYTCDCFDGYNGTNCENDIAECATTPCYFDSPCFENSNITLYETGHPLYEGESFSYATAAGFRCQCVTGSRGMSFKEHELYFN